MLIPWWTRCRKKFSRIATTQSFWCHSARGADFKNPCGAQYKTCCGTTSDKNSSVVASSAKNIFQLHCLQNTFWSSRQHWAAWDPAQSPWLPLRRGSRACRTASAKSSSGYSRSTATAKCPAAASCGWTEGGGLSAGRASSTEGCGGNAPGEWHNRVFYSRGGPREGAWLEKGAGWGKSVRRTRYRAELSSLPA